MKPRKSQECRNSLRCASLCAKPYLSMANRLLEALKNVVPWQVQAAGKLMESLKSFVAMILLALWLVGVIAHSSNGSYRWEIHAPIPPFYDGLSPFYLMISKSQRMASSSLCLDKIGVRLFSFGFWDSLKEWHQFRSWRCDLSMGQMFYDFRGV